MTLEGAYELLNLGLKTIRKEVRAAYRRAAAAVIRTGPRAGAGETCQARGQQINAAYQQIVQFIEDYLYDLVASTGPDDLRNWWANRFATGVWEHPRPRKIKIARII